MENANPEIKLEKDPNVSDIDPNSCSDELKIMETIWEEFQNLSESEQKSMLAILLVMFAEWELVTVRKQKRYLSFAKLCFERFRYLAGSVKTRAITLIPTGLERCMKYLPDWEPSEHCIDIHAKFHNVSPKELISIIRYRCSSSEAIENRLMREITLNDKSDRS